MKKQMAVRVDADLKHDVDILLARIHSEGGERSSFPQAVDKALRKWVKAQKPYRSIKDAGLFVAVD